MFKIVDFCDEIIEPEIEEDIEDPDKECFVCFEIKKIEELPIRLINQTIFLKTCECDGWIHNSCLESWFTINEKCPICRVKMTNNEFFEFEYIFYIMYIFYVIKTFTSKFCNIIIRLRNFFIFSALIINIYNIVYISNQYKNNTNYQECTSLNCSSLEFY